MAANEQCLCVSPDYHRARIVYAVGPLRLPAAGRWCTRCGELIPDLRFPVKQIVGAILSLRGEVQARADCVEHEHEHAA